MYYLPRGDFLLGVAVSLTIYSHRLAVSWMRDRFLDGLHPLQQKSRGLKDTRGKELGNANGLIAVSRMEISMREVID